MFRRAETPIQGAEVRVDYISLETLELTDEGFLGLVSASQEGASFEVQWLRHWAVGGILRRKAFRLCQSLI